jgi:putative Ca2+/H+ antiporter (TMEM165/GDT1 family)
MDLAVALAAFLVILPVELPDKTFVATLVLATRYHPVSAWTGVGLAFAVQSAIAVTFGGLLTRLPQQPVTLAAALLFATGAVVLWRSAGHASAQSEQTGHQVASRLSIGLSGLGAISSSFLVLFLAEWGDLSQLLTAGLVVRYQDPVSVFTGSWAALLLVSGLAALAGRALAGRLPLSALRRVSAGTCAALAALTLAVAVSSHFGG